MKPLKKGLSRKSKNKSSNEVPNRFLSMRVKRQTYLGASSIALYINDETLKVREKLLRLKDADKQ